MIFRSTMVVTKQPRTARLATFANWATLDWTTEAAQTVARTSTSTAWIATLQLASNVREAMESRPMGNAANA